MDLHTFTKHAIGFYMQVRRLVGPIRIGWDTDFFIKPNSAESLHVLGSCGKAISYDDVAKFLIGFSDDDFIIARLGNDHDRKKRIKKANKETRKMIEENGYNSHDESDDDIWTANGYTDQDDFYNQMSYDYSNGDEHFIIILGHL